MSVKEIKYFLKVYQKNDNGVTSTVCYHDTYAFQSESTLYSCQNVKEFLL